MNEEITQYFKDIGKKSAKARKEKMSPEEYKEYYKALQKKSVLARKRNKKLKCPTQK